MERFSRSMSSRENPSGLHSNPSSMRDLRSYSCTSDFKSDNNKKGHNRNKSKISAASSWNFNADPAELQRKKRVAGYKAFSVEGKVKTTFRKSFRWIKDIVVHRFR